MKVFLASLLLFAPLGACAGSAVPKLPPAEAARLVDAGQAVLVDVREPDEWTESGVAAPAVLLAKSDFDGAQAQWKPFLEQHRDRTLVLYCRSGRRADVIGAALAQRGFTVANAGGFAAWKDAGLPVRAAPAQP
jgi:rhodanese-related sulfurtransferase